METKLKTEISLPKWADGHPDPLGVGLLELAHLGGLLHTEVDLVRVLAHNLQLDVLITHFGWKFWLGSEIWKERKVRQDLYLNKISNTKIKTFWIIKWISKEKKSYGTFLEEMQIKIEKYKVSGNTISDALKNTLKKKHKNYQYFEILLFYWIL